MTDRDYLTNLNNIINKSDMTDAVKIVAIQNLTTAYLTFITLVNS